MTADTLRMTGMGLIVGGAVAASPLDEAALAAISAGAALPVIPIQGTLTLASGVTSMAAGAFLMWQANKLDRKR